MGSIAEQYKQKLKTDIHFTCDTGEHTKIKKIKSFFTKTYLFVTGVWLSSLVWPIELVFAEFPVVHTPKVVLVASWLNPLNEL